MPGGAPSSRSFKHWLTMGYRKHSVLPEPVPVETRVVRPPAMARIATSWWLRRWVMLSGIRSRRCGWSNPSSTSDETVAPSRNGRDRLTYGPLSKGERRVRSSDRRSRICLCNPGSANGISGKLVAQEATDDVLGVGDRVQSHCVAAVLASRSRSLPYRMANAPDTRDTPRSALS